MKLVPALLAPALLVTAFLGTACNKEGVDAYADEICACTDTACMKQVQEKYAELPELKMKLKDAESMPADKQMALAKAMSCAIKLQTEGKGASSGGDTTAPSKPAPKLTTHENAAMGYTIDLPEGFETTHEDGNAGMYGFDTLIIKVDPSGVPLKTPDDLLRGVNTGEGKVDKKTEGDVVLVIVEQPQMPLNIYAGPVGKKLASHCMAEPSMRDLAVKICTSLRAK
ncbi:MAG: hypothetical protein R3B72_08630 [Polyangiaceae bacterium]